MTVAAVYLWGRQIGAVDLEDGQSFAVFQYDPDFARSGIQVAPFKMPLADTIYSFPALPLRSFHGLPGLLADSLPDKFGNALIDAWLASQGRTAGSFNAVERLLYTGTRGMGALEFRPSHGPKERKLHKVNLDALVKLASEILTHRNSLTQSFAHSKREQALKEILRIGTSAGGARAKAVIAWNPTTQEVRSGQITAGSGFTYWILKFDGVSGNKDKDLTDPMGFGLIEYAYSKIAKAAGIVMADCQLLEENGRHHFLTKRFDRLDDGEKLHMQSLTALQHFDFNSAGAYSYEQVMLTIRELGLSMDAIEQQFRRAVFNIIGRNQDDHVKNIAFLMDKFGNWSLSPAFDISYSYNPDGDWTSQHQMTINGKRDGFSIADLMEFAEISGLKRGRGKAILDEVVGAVAQWKAVAEEVGVFPAWRKTISENLRLKLPNV